MAGSMDPGLVEAVRRDIYHALARTAPGSTLPDDEQDALLAQACAEACDVLGRWLASSSWAALRPSADAARRPLADAIADWEQMRPFLNPVREALGRASRDEGDPDAPTDPEAYIDKLINSATFTARRHRGLTRQDLYQDADGRLAKLRDQSCKLASDFRADAEERARGAADAAAKRASDEKRHARWVLTKRVLVTVAKTLFTISVTLASVSPALMQANISTLEHGTVQMVNSAPALFVHNVAHAAAPAVAIAPPRLGPRLG